MSLPDPVPDATLAPALSEPTSTATAVPAAGAIEAAIDLGTSAPHPLAKIGKDVASTAALVSAIVFGVIVILILVPRLIDRLAG